MVHIPDDEGSAKDRKHTRREIGGLILQCYRTETARNRGRKNLGKSVLDMSMGGARFLVTDPVEKGASLTVELKDSISGDVFFARGTVKRAESTGEEGLPPVHSVGVKWDEIFTPLGKREKFFYGRSPAPKPSAPEPEREEPEPRPAPVQKEERFQVDDYVASVAKSGLFGMGRRKSMAITVVSLSTDGAQIEMHEKLEKGAKVAFTIHLNKFADTFEASATVVWVKENATPSGPVFFTGIVFSTLGQAQKKLLDHMMSWFTSYQAKYRKAHKGF